MSVRSRSTVLVLGVIGIALIELASISEFSPKFIWNGSKSAPTGIYFVVEKEPVFGDFVVVKVSEQVQNLIDSRQYLPSKTPLIKRIAATNGDEICRKNVQILINKKPVAKALFADTNAQKMPEWNGCFVLESGELFLLNDHPNSLDGRYFGLTQSSQVIGVAHPIWVRQNSDH